MKTSDLVTALERVIELQTKVEMLEKENEFLRGCLSETLRANGAIYASQEARAIGRFMETA